MTELFIMFPILMWAMILWPLLPWAFVMSPWSIRQTEKAGKGFAWATYPRESYGGNWNEAQRVHEGGGLRFSWLAVGPAMVVTGALCLWFGAMAFPAQVVVGGAVWALTRSWVDLSEHQAEVMYAEAHGFGGYRAGELSRMVHDPEYSKRTRQWIEDKWASRVWASRLIVKLAR